MQKPATDPDLNQARHIFGLSAEKAKISIIFTLKDQKDLKGPKRLKRR
jgi:hypothetical protein